MSPAARFTTCPPLNTSSVGITSMPYRSARARHPSTFTFTIWKSSYLAAISSSVGPKARQGPHQVAQKSTKTGFSLCSTAASKVSSFACTIVIANASFSFSILPHIIYENTESVVINAIKPKICREKTHHRPRPACTAPAAGHLLHLLQKPVIAKPVRTLAVAIRTASKKHSGPGLTPPAAPNYLL